MPFSIGAYEFFTHTGKDGALVMPDGSLLLSVSGRTSQDEPGRVFVVRSYDGGRTWGQPSVVAHDPENAIGFGEPPLLRLSSGRLLTMIRTGDYLLPGVFDGRWMDVARGEALADMGLPRPLHRAGAR